MNKLLIAPLILMMVISVFGSLLTNQSSSYDSPAQRIEHSMYVEDERKNFSMEITEEQKFKFSFWDTALILTVIVTALGLGTVAGTKILGSGISETSQRIIIILAIYTVIWGIFSAINHDIFFSNSVFMVGYMFLTAIFAFGLAQHALNQVAIE